MRRKAKGIYPPSRASYILHRLLTSLSLTGKKVNREAPLTEEDIDYYFELHHRYRLKKINRKRTAKGHLHTVYCTYQESKKGKVASRKCASRVISMMDWMTKERRERARERIRKMRRREKSDYNIHHE
jgi:hypothetical protein